MKPQPLVHMVSDQEVRSIWGTRLGVEDFLLQMRKRGARQIESIQAICLLEKVSLREAKKIVHFSRAWADTREYSEALHEEFYHALEDLSHDEDTEVSKQLAS